MVEEKVLCGFWRNGAEHKMGSYGTEHYRVYVKKLVPVRLKKESVSLRWLEDWCREHHDYFFMPHHKDLLLAASKEAEK